MLFPRIQPRYAAMLALLAIGVAALLANPFAGASDDDIQAYCDGNRPVITRRPAGTEHIEVICRYGLPDFMVEQAEVADYDPVTQSLPVPEAPYQTDRVTVWLNNHPLIIPYDPVRGVQEPGAYLTTNGRVLIPVRFFTEAFGGKVEWSPRDRSATMQMPGQNRVLQVWVDRYEAKANGQWENLDQPAVLFQDRVFVPVRFLVEGFGAAIEWDGPRYRAMIYMDGITCSSPLYCGEVE
jgi:hypothetical protein